MKVTAAKPFFFSCQEGWLEKHELLIGLHVPFQI